ncbi:hypothetical protein JHK82_051392 [Glycine max]|nr:hypothetical protein JHK82_051392 [Glycine max]
MELKVGLLLFLLGFTATSVDATRFNPSSFITKGDSHHYVKVTYTWCDPECEVCRCDFEWPPNCKCMDNTGFSAYQE